MMKTLIIIILLLLPLSFGNAKVDFSGLSFVLSDDIQLHCRTTSLDTQGCFLEESDAIVISNLVDIRYIRTVLLHEIGHFLMKDVSLEEYQAVFSEWMCQEKECLRETAAIYFTLWLDKIPMFDKYQKFFLSLFQ